MSLKDTHEAIVVDRVKKLQRVCTSLAENIWRPHAPHMKLIACYGRLIKSYK
jgi:hypothetical protein